MKKLIWTKSRKKMSRITGVLLSAGMAVLIVGCGGETSAPETEQAENSSSEEETVEGNPEETENGDPDATESGEETEYAEAEDADTENVGDSSAIANESANDAQIDFKSLQGENPEIFGWLHVPDTSIDAPILQSTEGDDYYLTHNAMKEDDNGGALFIEAANLASMCDFNTVIHGKTDEDGENGLFADLYRFADPDFFDSHEQLYVYLDGNVLTYEVFAAYERENTSLLRTYDFTYIDGCNQFLEDMYGIRDMSMMIRTGWDEVTPYHFLITLTTSKGDSSDKQFVVLAALIDDPAGKINRSVYE